MEKTPSIEFRDTNENTDAAVISGSWTLKHAAEIKYDKSKTAALKGGPLRIYAEELGSFDTSGAMMLLKILGAGEKSEIYLNGFSENQEKIINLVRPYFGDEKDENEGKKTFPGVQSFLIKAGKKSAKFAGGILDTLNFTGKSSVNLLQDLLNPRTLRIRELFVQLEQVLIGAVPVISLVMFMIGVVIAYISASQIEKYGVGIFIVDGIALAILRELSPVIVSIVVAGRSGSAFTAQLGTMKMNEEIDAITTLGLSPVKVLVVPRICALVLSMPLLVFIGDLVGVGAGMIVSDLRIGISYATFTERFQSAVPVRWLLLGLFKAPVFAAVIALIACRNGFNAESNARSVGLNTTNTVVQSIVSVIILNAVFAVIFQELKL